MSQNIKIGNNTLNGVDTIQVPLARDITQFATFTDSSVIPSVSGGYTFQITNTDDYGFLEPYVLGYSDLYSTYGWKILNFSPENASSEVMTNVSFVCFKTNENAIINSITSNSLYAFDGTTITTSNFNSYKGKLLQLKGNCVISITDV